MKSRLVTLGSLQVLLLITVQVAHATPKYSFGTDVPLSHGTGSVTTGSRGAHSIAARGNRVFVAWEDGRDGYPAIYMARSLNGGKTFEPEIRVNESGSGSDLRIAADATGDRVFVLWMRAGPPDAGLYFDRSIDGGATFGKDRFLGELCTGTEGSGGVMATHGDNLVVLAWVVEDSIYVMRSTDGGDSFDCPARVATFASEPFHCCPEITDAVIAPDGTVYVVYTTADGDLGACWDPHVLTSHDGGVSFETTGGAGCGLQRSFACSESGQLHVIGSDYRTPVYDYWPWYGNSMDGGGTWDGVRRLDVPHWGGGAPAVSIDARGHDVAAVWTRPEEGHQLVASISRDDGATFGEPLNVSDGPGAGVPSVAIMESGDVCVVWTQNERVYFDRGALMTRRPASDDLESSVVPLATRGALRASPNPGAGEFDIEWSQSAVEEPPFRAIEIFDARGRLVRALSTVPATEGSGTVHWDGRDGRGDAVPDGVYFARPRGAGEGVARIVILH